MSDLVVADAWAQHRCIVLLKDSIERSFLALGKELCEFDEMQHWETLGYNSFNAYVADPDVDIGASTAHRLKRVYRKFVLEMGLSHGRLLEAGNKKLEMIAAHVNEKNLEELLNKASALSRKDLRAELNGSPSVDWQAVLRRTRYLCYLLTEHAPDSVRESAIRFRDATRMSE